MNRSATALQNLSNPKRKTLLAFLIPTMFRLVDSTGKTWNQLKDWIFQSSEAISRLKVPIAA